MNRILCLLSVIVVFVACSQPTSKSETTRIPRQYSITQLFDNKSISGTDFNNDETAVLTQQNGTGIFNVYAVSIADTQSTPLTNSARESIFAVSYLPGTNAFLYSADNNGDENSHLFLRRRGDSTAKDLTPWLKSANSFMGWSADKKSLYFTGNHRDPKFFDLYKMDTVHWNAAMIFKNDSGYGINGISKSERYLMLTKAITTDKNECYLYDNRTKQQRRLSNDDEANWQPMAITANDSTLYYTTNDSSEFTYLVRYNLGTGTKEKIYSDKWDVTDMQLSDQENFYSITVNEDGKNKVLLFTVADNKPVAMPDFKNSDVAAIIISPSEKNLLLTVGSSTSPANLYVYNRENKSLKQLTASLNKAIDPKDLVTATVIRFPSFDDKEIPAIYYKPLQASASEQVPALVWVHGGPGGQSRIGYSNAIQYLVNHGYAVLAVNNRGSSGYGKTFYKLDNKDHSNGDLNDCIWAKQWLASQPYIDSAAIGIEGGSYGGCMVLGALAFHPDAFKVGVDLFGVANWMRTLKSIPPYWEATRKALYDEMGDPYTADSIMLKKTSPLFHYQTINKPLLVFQGANDVRVLPAESDEIVAGVKRNGVPVEYVVYPDEGHGFVKRNNLVTTSEHTLQFLDKYLKPHKHNLP